MKFGQFKVIAEPDLPACWLYRNIRVAGYVGEVGLVTDQYIRRPIDHLFADALNMFDRLVKWDRHALGDGDIVEVKEIDDYGTLKFKFRYWGVPER